MLSSTNSIKSGSVICINLNCYCRWISKKITNVRLWEDDKKKPWRLSVSQAGYEVLCVSQFTLLASLKGNKPSFHEAMPPSEARVLYSQFLSLTKEAYENGRNKENQLERPESDDEDIIKDGVFGAMMEVSLVNDGPVTLLFDSHDKNYDK